MASGNGITGTDKDKKDRKEWLLLLLSLLLAFIIWLIHSLSLQYSVFLEYNVSLSSSLEGRSRTAMSEDVLIVRGRSEGYYILRQRIGRRKTLQVTVPPGSIVHKGGDVFAVNCENIKSNIVEALGGNVNLDFIVSESLDFNFPRMASKKVPIVPKTSIVFGCPSDRDYRLSLDRDHLGNRSRRSYSGYLRACANTPRGLFGGQHILLS